MVNVVPLLVSVQYRLTDLLGLMPEVAMLGWDTRTGGRAPGPKRARGRRRARSR